MPRRADYTTVEISKEVYRKLASEALEKGVSVPQLISQRARAAEAGPRGLDAVERRLEMLETVVQEVVAKKRRRTA